MNVYGCSAGHLYELSLLLSRWPFPGGSYFHRGNEPLERNSWCDKPRVNVNVACFFQIAISPHRGLYIKPWQPLVQRPLDHRENRRWDVGPSTSSLGESYKKISIHCTLHPWMGKHSALHRYFGSICLRHIGKTLHRRPEHLWFKCCSTVYLSYRAC